MTETEVKLRLFKDYEAIHGLVLSEEHKQKMMDDLDLHSFVLKLTEYTELGYQAMTVLGG